jgi:hypothetical protein
LFASDNQEQYESLCNFHYSKTEKQKVLEAVATAMLVHRDHIIDTRLNERENDKAGEREGEGEEEEKDDFEDSMIRKFVEDVIDHYNNPEIQDKVMDFLKKPQKDGRNAGEGERGGGGGNMRAKGTNSKKGIYRDVQMLKPKKQELKSNTSISKFSFSKTVSNLFHVRNHNYTTTSSLSGHGKGTGKGKGNGAKIHIESGYPSRQVAMAHPLPAVKEEEAGVEEAVSAKL